MDISFDPAKRQATLENRGLDFADAEQVFAGHHFTKLDLRQDYGELRFQTVGVVNGEVVFLVWTPRGSGIRVISMRKAKEGERNEYWKRVG